jgi:exonuclease VII small subunit
VTKIHFADVKQQNIFEEFLKEYEAVVRMLENQACRLKNVRS